LSFLAQDGTHETAEKVADVVNDKVRPLSSSAASCVPASMGFARGRNGTDSHLGGVETAQPEGPKLIPLSFDENGGRRHTAARLIPGGGRKLGMRFWGPKNAF
jgi:hypothetical protein